MLHINRGSQPKAFSVPQNQDNIKLATKVCAYFNQPDQCNRFSLAPYVDLNVAMKIKGNPSRKDMGLCYETFNNALLHIEQRQWDISKAPYVMYVYDPVRL
ncbi:MAG: hypothetical protein K2X98_06650 [Alphaproteobacteria bacterium]|nr:hypothetical protein [Alphaproteobacteria bacterium]